MSAVNVNQTLNVAKIVVPTPKTPKGEWIFKPLVCVSAILPPKYLSEKTTPKASDKPFNIHSFALLDIFKCLSAKKYETESATATNAANK